MNMKTIKEYRLVILVLLLNMVLYFMRPGLSIQSFDNSYKFCLEVLKILPPILVLMSLLDAWIPKEMMEAHLGKKSGMRGALISLFLGSAAAGPIFAAFPIAKTFFKKGVSTANVVIFLGAWATIKVPMIIIESSFLGMRFSLLRLFITIPFILSMGYLVEKFSGKDESFLP